MTKQEAIKVVYDMAEMLISDDTELEVFTALSILESIAYPKDKKEGDIETELEPRPYFQKWAKEHGINMEDKEDWLPWWECWGHGYNKGISDIKEIL